MCNLCEIWHTVWSDCKICSKHHNTGQWTHHDVECTCVRKPVRSVPALEECLNWESYHRFHLCRWCFPWAESLGSKVKRAHLLETPTCQTKFFSCYSVRHQLVLKYFTHLIIRHTVSRNEAGNHCEIILKAQKITTKMTFVTFP